MELTILHLYPDCMSLYGEYANVSVLRRHLEAMGVSVTVRTAGLDDAPDFTGVGFVYMGAGTERGQKWALAALLPHAQTLRELLDDGTPALFTGNAMELLGRSVTDKAGKVWPCLALADYATTETDRRVPEDVIAHTSLWDAPAVGFMNKCSHTTGVTAPLFDRLTLGEGNEGERGPEGYVRGNLFATHLTGPVLVKNPAFTRLLLTRIFQHEGWTLPESLPVLSYEEEAYQVTLQELSRRAGN